MAFLHPTLSRNKEKQNHIGQEITLVKKYKDVKIFPTK